MAFNHSTIQAFNHSSIQAFNHSSIQPFKHSSIQAFKHSIIQSFKHSSIQAFKHSSIQATLPYFYRFYKNLFKNPLLSIIPSFIPSCINPHHIFQPFDSISPIFKPVGLTELNSIQGEDDGKSRSGVKKLYQILVDAEYFYQVPDYQRPYVWDKDHLGALIDDLVGSYINNREDEYFCGSIVIAENPKDKRWDVVDGQQRLTSFIILACTILRLCKRRLGQKSKDFIEGSIYDKYDKEKERLKFLTAQNYNSIFENTVLNNLEFEDNIKKSEWNKKFDENTYLRNAYYFRELLNESMENGSISDMDDFVEWFYEHIALTRIICFEQDSAMQIFQVLNDRGQPLSPIDILKSSLMQEIKQDSEKRKDFITTWDKLVEACKSVEGIDIVLEDFFNMYLEYADPSSSKKRADKGLKKVFKDSKKDACEFIYDVSAFMESYTDLLKKPDRYIYLLRYLPSRFWASILTTVLYVKYPDFDALKRLLVSYYYQTWIAGGTITRIKQTSINIIKNVKSNKDIETIQELILDNIESYNTFNQYHYNLWESSSVYPSKWLRPVLALANYFMTDE